MPKTARLIFFLLLFISPAAGAQTGTIQRVRCQADTTQEYALYIPAPCSPEKPAPLLLFFDPAARGNLPVRLYQSLADEFGIILAGSFNSQNFDGGSTIKAFVSLYNDLTGNHNIDLRRIWVSGFSGGARAAALVAMQYREVTGVIGCGAGFAGSGEIDSATLHHYAAIVGDRDMNYGELMDNAGYLDGKKISNLLLVFDGEHTWPPVASMGLAMEWLGSETGMDIKNTPRGDLQLNRATQKADSGWLYPAWWDAMQLARIPSYREKAQALQQQLENKKDFATDKRVFEQSALEETNQMNAFSILFSAAVLEEKTVAKKDWSSLAAYVRGMKKDAQAYRRACGQRCYDHCTRSCMEQYFQFMQQREYKKAALIPPVLQYFMPESGQPDYYMARISAATGNKKEAEQYLKAGIKKGMTFSSFVEQDPELAKQFTAGELKALWQ